MTKHIGKGAEKKDAELCNAVDLPQAGCHAGAGSHVVIPADWKARIAAGEAVPGCTFHALGKQGPYGGPYTEDTLFVSEQVVVRIEIPEVVAALPQHLQAHIPTFKAKLAAAEDV